MFVIKLDPERYKWGKKKTFCGIIFLLSFFPYGRGPRSVLSHLSLSCGKADTGDTGHIRCCSMRRQHMDPSLQLALNPCLRWLPCQARVPESLLTPVLWGFPPLYFPKLLLHFIPAITCLAGHSSSSVWDCSFPELPRQRVHIFYLEQYSFSLCSFWTTVFSCMSAIYPFSFSDGTLPEIVHGLYTVPWITRF